MFPSMKDSGLILLQTVPKTIDVYSLKKSILKEFPQILNVHDLHVWCLTSTEIIATLHIALPSQTTESYFEFTSKLNTYFALNGITLATVQPEFCDNGFEKCLYICNNECDEKTCCKDKEEEDTQNEQHLDEVITSEEMNSENSIEKSNRESLKSDI
ncbi:zinc transporter 1-like isoform X2 [Leptotrombidium deliense]|uniref:Zinc transporter 1-like isoform X2 n=1 Tax=Leptotrombidium deliense TaxID=299467 RepID=A0A443S9Q3_9ACAR|nr:zinc transporter 1-like isoform X2 [Leptotrombidium deliense]